MTNAPILSQSHVRNELQIYLSELQTDDPRRDWRGERESGRASGVDQVFHFFFDDHDFDASAVGSTLCNEAEVRLLGALKEALVAVLDAVGNAGDNDFVSHPLWLRVKQAATAAAFELARVPNGC